MLRTAFALLALSLSVTAGAQALKGHNANAPVDIAAERIELQSRADRAVFAGNVQVTQSGLSMTAGRVTVAYADKSGSVAIQRIDASGGVTVKSASETARGDVAIYDLNRRLITMIGGVTLTQGANQVNGGRLVIDLNSGRSVIDGGGAPGVTNSGGRVTGRFTVPQRN
jgi:lipopolysaccharide export system protein LptA